MFFCTRTLNNLDQPSPNSPPPLEIFNTAYIKLSQQLTYPDLHIHTLDQRAHHLHTGTKTPLFREQKETISEYESLVQSKSLGDPTKKEVQDPENLSTSTKSTHEEVDQTPSIPASKLHTRRPQISLTLPPPPSSITLQQYQDYQDEQLKKALEEAPPSHLPPRPAPLTSLLFHPATLHHLRTLARDQNPELLPIYSI